MGKVLTRNGLKFLLTAAGIFLIGSLPYLLFDMKDQLLIWRLVQQGKLMDGSYLEAHLHFRLGDYLSHSWVMVQSMFHPETIQYLNEYGEKEPLFPTFFHTYLQGMYFLGCAMVIGLFCGMFFTYLLMLIPARGRKPFRFLVFIFESIPDIFVIIIFQWLILSYSARTGHLLMNTLSIFGDAVTLPIICLSFLPAFYITKYLLTAFEEEEEEQYVEFAKGKGLRRAWILLVHVFRNALITLFNHFKTVFWLGLSNLFALDIIFQNNDGFMAFLTAYGKTNPVVVTTGLLMVFIPFFILLTLGEMLIHDSNDVGRKAS